MNFPVHIHLGFMTLHSHLVFEVLAYFIGFRVYQRERAKADDVVGDSDRWTVILAAAVGAAIGSKVLHHLASPTRFIENWPDPVFLMGGKTIVGGLLGGLIAVETVKRAYKINRRTGDLFAMPLCVAIFIGRIGCFLSGVEDDTVGVHTTVAWAIDFGDGLRHPTALYEMVYVWVLGLYLNLRSKRPHAEGELFASFMLGYLSFRFVCDFVKPYEVIFGLRGIQWACLFGMAHYINVLREMRTVKRKVMIHG